MSRDEFRSIDKFFHLEDNLNPNNKSDRLRKIRDFMTMLSSKWKSIYTPGTNLALDETVVAYKGQILFKTYNPDKPHKWGMKIYVLADSISGYSLK